jgi:hypothetical protein
MRIKKLLGSPLPDALYLKLRYRASYGRWPNLHAPTDINEYVLGHMLTSNNKLMAATVDKWGVRGYVKEAIGEEFLTELYLHTADVGDIQTSRLPTSFVMKPSHASGRIRIVADKTQTSDELLRSEARKWLRLNYHRVAREWVYRDIPRSIVVEQNLSVNGTPPLDYKLYVRDGKCFLIHVDTERFSRHRRAFYDRNWNRLAVTWRYPEADDVARPQGLGLMLEISEQLAKPFPFVRVDLYEVADRIVFGELTHFPEAGHGCRLDHARTIFAMMKAAGHN